MRQISRFGPHGRHTGQQQRADGRFVFGTKDADAREKHPQSICDHDAKLLLVGEHAADQRDVGVLQAQLLRHRIAIHREK